MLIEPVSVSIRLLGVLWSSSCSMAVSASIVNIVVTSLSEVLMIAFTCSVVGIIWLGGL